MNIDLLNEWKKPSIMGVLNVTPDSFSDGGRYLSRDKACLKAEALIKQGADIIDVGGESTRPSAKPVSLDEELARVIPVIEQLKQSTDCSISIDTCKPEVMREAVLAGATMINDVNALRSPGALELVSTLSVSICLMHMQGNPENMQDNPGYPQGIMKELKQFFEERISACLAAGIEKKRLILDPGFGFGKTQSHNLLMLNQLEQLCEFDLPLLLGVSRKRTIGDLLSKDVDERMIGSLSLAIYASFKGVGLIRTHDVDETSQAYKMLEAVMNAV